jgi:4-hydroxy-tetrahydrodipicolinate synthase
LCRIVNFSVDGGIEYLVILGTTAENATLSRGKELVIKTVVECNNGRLPLVLGVSGNNTMKVVEELKLGICRRLLQIVSFASLQ